jgi:hypothetical protein
VFELIQHQERTNPPSPPPPFSSATSFIAIWISFPPPPLSPQNTNSNKSQSEQVTKQLIIVPFIPNQKAPEVISWDDSISSLLPSLEPKKKHKRPDSYDIEYDAPKTKKSKKEKLRPMQNPYTQHSRSFTGYGKGKKKNKWMKHWC